MKRKLVSIILVCVLGVFTGTVASFGNSSSEAKEEEEADKEEETTDREEVIAGEVEENGKEKTEESDEEKDEPEAEAEESDHTTVTIYAAESLQTVMEDLINMYNEIEPDVEIVGNYDSSDSLLTQIEKADGDGIDIFFSAAQSQMDTLQDDDHLVVGDTRYNVVDNQVCVITYTDSGTEVTDLETLGKAKSLAIVDSSVPVGEYTRQAMVNADLLPETADVSTITTKEISDALDSVEINEYASGSDVLQAVSEQSDQVGTVYYSDIYGYEDQVEILQVISDDLTGDIIYPVAQVANESADEPESEAALDFIHFITSDAAKDIFVEYYFDVDVTDD